MNAPSALAVFHRLADDVDSGEPVRIQRAQDFLNSLSNKLAAEHLMLAIALGRSTAAGTLAAQIMVGSWVESPYADLELTHANIETAARELIGVLCLTLAHLDKGVLRDRGANWF